MELLNTADFYAIMSDDSMVGAHIGNGDEVLFVAQNVVENGAVAAVQLGGGNLVIRRVYVYPDKEQILLRADNPRYEPLICNTSDDFKIIGKAIGCLSKVA